MCVSGLVKGGRGGGRKLKWRKVEVKNEEVEEEFKRREGQTKMEGSERQSERDKKRRKNSERDKTRRKR